MNLIVTTYIQGPRHYCQLLVQGYRYVKHRSNKKSTYWKCHQYDMGACKARCTISMENTVSLTGNHSHEPEDEEEDHTILVQEVRKLIKHPYAYHQKRKAIHKVKMFDYVDMDNPHQQDEQLLEDVDYDEEAAEEG